MMTPVIPGFTRTRIARRHALIAPDGLVPSTLPGITGATANVIISPAMGANLTQLLVTFPVGGAATFAASARESFAYVMRGACTATIEARSAPLGEGGYVFAPAGLPLALTDPTPGTQVTLFQKTFAPLGGVEPPPPVFGHESAAEGVPFLGDPDARLQTLLPDRPEFDFAVNRFTYQPGARLPFVETHVMEHGLVMLAGEGIYRLEDAWYPVTAGDAIWMAPYCPQWFVAMGRTPATYLYCKDVNRPPHA